MYRECQTGTDHVIIPAKLRIPPKWLHNCKKSKAAKHLQHKRQLLNDESVQRQRINNHTLITPETISTT